MENVRFVVDYEPYPELDHLDQWNTPEKYAEAPVMVRTGNGDERRALTFEEYERSYGDPDNYTVYWCRKECRCKCCNQWVVTDSIGGLDEYFGPYAEVPNDTTLQEGTFAHDELPVWVRDHFTADWEQPA